MHQAVRQLLAMHTRKTFTRTYFLQGLGRPCAMRVWRISKENGTLENYLRGPRCISISICVLFYCYNNKKTKISITASTFVFVFDQRSVLFIYFLLRPLLGLNEVLPSREHFHSRGQQPCKFIVTKESFYIRKEFNSHRIGLAHQHGCRFIVLVHQYGCRVVM